MARDRSSDPLIWIATTIRALQKDISEVKCKLAHVDAHPPLDSSNTKNVATKPFVFNHDAPEFFPQCEKQLCAPPGVLSVTPLPVLVSTLMHEIKDFDSEIVAANLPINCEQCESEDITHTVDSSSNQFVDADKSEAFKEMFKTFFEETTAISKLVIKEAMSPVLQTMHGIWDKVESLHSRITIVENKTVARPAPAEVFEFDELCKSLRSLTLKRYSFVRSLSNDQSDLMMKKRRKKGRCKGDLKKMDHEGSSEA